MKPHSYRNATIGSTRAARRAGAHAAARQAINTTLAPNAYPAGSNVSTMNRTDANSFETPNASTVPGTIPNPQPEDVTVTSNDASGYTLSVHRTAFTPHDLPLGIGVGAGSLAAVPIAPAADLYLATASGPSAPGGDIVATSVGFVSPLPVVAAGHYTATLTFTVIGK